MEERVGDLEAEHDYLIESEKHNDYLIEYETPLQSLHSTSSKDQVFLIFSAHFFGPRNQVLLKGSTI